MHTPTVYREFNTCLVDLSAARFLPSLNVYIFRYVSICDSPQRTYLNYLLQAGKYIHNQTYMCIKTEVYQHKANHFSVLKKFSTVTVKASDRKGLQTPLDFILFTYAC
jgi:hypothetical protein